MKYGPFQLELFKNETNNFLPISRGDPKDSFDITWAGKIIYGNPVFINKFLYSTFEKACTDFKEDPENTVFIFVVPKWDTAPWWIDFRKYFDIVEEYPTNTALFTVPYRSHFIPQNTQLSSDGRVLVGGTEWPVVVLYKDINTATKLDSKLLAHLRFGHVAGRKLQYLQDSGAKLGLTYGTKTHTLHCDVCSASKATRMSFPASHRGGSTVPGQLIFTDILVVNIESYEGYLYVVQFTDDATRFTKVYFLKSRTGVYSALEKFLKWFPTQVNFTSPMVVYNVQKICVRTVQSDGAGEYTGEEFSNILSKHTVGLRTTAPYVHENAAIAERLWRTLEDMCRALLATSGLPKKAWPIAFRHAVYLYNKMTHPHLENKISPYEKLRGEKPDLSIVRTFGSRAWALIAPDEPRRKQAGHKLDDRAEEYKYVGHDETSTTYLLYDQENNKILRKGMVKIVEDVDHALWKSDKL